MHEMVSTPTSIYEKSEYDRRVAWEKEHPALAFIERILCDEIWYDSNDDITVEPAPGETDEEVARRIRALKRDHRLVQKVSYEGHFLPGKHIR